MIPSTIQLFHTLDSHEHTICSETESHLCQTEINCNICAFEALPSNETAPTITDYGIKQSILKKEINYTSIVFSSHILSNKQLRAPPYNS